MPRLITPASCQAGRSQPSHRLEERTVTVAPTQLCPAGCRAGLFPPGPTTPVRTKQQRLWRALPKTPQWEGCGLDSNPGLSASTAWAPAIRPGWCARTFADFLVTARPRATAPAWLPPSYASKGSKLLECTRQPSPLPQQPCFFPGTWAHPSQ